MSLNLLDSYSSKTTIAAIATPIGIGGVGIIRISGHLSLTIAEHFLNKIPKPRYAYFCQFKEQATGQVIDEGLLIYFKAPHSFTGEDIIEIQCHGSIVVLQQLLKYCFQLGAVPAKPGEFSERAFLNNKMDLIQAEAINDLINSQSEAQAKAAVQSLTGKFSDHINLFLSTLTNLRVYVESCIDFSEEDIDFIEQYQVKDQLINLIDQLDQLIKNAYQGKVLTDGLNVVLIGKPNVGKSSLLNALSGTNSAIVTNIPGTTRDVLKEQITIDGLPLHIIDTAGIRETDNLIEKEGIKRTFESMQKADLILCLYDDQDRENDVEKILIELNLNDTHIPTIFVYNKVDASGRAAGRINGTKVDSVAISAKALLGLDDLKSIIKEKVGFKPQESIFSARARHLEKLHHVMEHLKQGLFLLKDQHEIEIIAEELRFAQNRLGEITGYFSSDDLLGEIFSSFCIGK